MCNDLSTFTSSFPFPFSVFAFVFLFRFSFFFFFSLPLSFNRFLVYFCVLWEREGREEKTNLGVPFFLVTSGQTEAYQG